MKLILMFGIYLSPVLVLLILLLRTSSYKIKKRRQVCLYFIEIYYVSLFLTMTITKIQNGYFFIWNGSISFDVFLDRFFISVATYQIFVLIKRKLDSSAEIDSYQAIKYLIERILLFKQFNSIHNINKELEIFEQKNILNPMLNKESKDIINQIKSYDYDTEDFEIFLSICIIDLEHRIQAESFSWTESFLLNLLK